MTEMLTGLCVPRLSAALMRQADWEVRESSLCGQMTADMAERLTKTADAWLLPIRGVKGFESAQVGRRSRILTRRHCKIAACRDCTRRARCWMWTATAAAST